MANFIFSEGATLMSSTGLDWVNTDYDCALVSDTIGAVPARNATWADISSHSNAEQPYMNKSITTFGACAADPLKFTAVTPGDPDGRFLGFVIKRNVDNLLIAWFDQGFSNLNPDPDASGAAVPIGDLVFPVMAQATFTFTLRPGIDNEGAWFRP